MYLASAVARGLALFLTVAMLVGGGLWVAPGGSFVTPHHALAATSTVAPSVSRTFPLSGSSHVPSFSSSFRFANPLASLPSWNTLPGLGGHPGLPLSSTPTSVNATIIPHNNTVLPGNVLPLDGNLPLGAAVNTSDEYLYTANMVTNTVSVLNATSGKLLAFIPVGSEPISVVYDPADGLVYVSSLNGSSLSIIRGLSVIATLTGIGYPFAAAYDSVNSDVYVGTLFPAGLTLVQGTSVVGSVSLTAGYPNDLAVDSLTGDVFVSLTPTLFSPAAQAIVEVVSGTTELGTVPVGRGSSGMAYDSANHEMYVANPGSNNITVLSTLTKVGTIATPGFNSSGLSFDTASATMYVAGVGQFHLLMVNGMSISGSVLLPYIISFSAGFGSPLLYDGASGMTYAIDPMVDQIFVINGSVWDRAMSVGYEIIGVGYENTTGYLYIIDLASNKLYIVNGTTDLVAAAIPTGELPLGGAVDTANGDLYLSNYGSNNVSLIHGLSVVGSVSVGSGPSVAVYDSTDKDVYVANTQSSTVSVLQGTSVVATISLPGNVSSFLFDPATGYVYASITNRSYVDVIQGTASLGRIATGNLPGPMALNTSSDRVYVANTGSKNVSVISGLLDVGTVGLPQNGTAILYDRLNGYVDVTSSDNVTEISGTSVVANVPTGKTPSSIALDTGTGALYVGNSGSNTVSVIQGISDIAYVTVGVSPDGVGYNPVNGNIAVANEFSGTISVIGNVSTPVVSLVSVAASPPGANLTAGQKATFTAVPTCSGGGCPTGVTYVWTLTNGALGNLSATTGTSVTFTAGGAKGNLSLFINGTLGTTTRMSPPVPISISVPASSVLTGVTVSPSGKSLSGGASQLFTATPVCSSVCPSGTTYVWALTQPSLGQLNSLTGSSTTFTANNTAGSLNLGVTATLGAVSKTTSVPITITSSTVPSLVSVSVNPTSSSVHPKGSAPFTATPSCGSFACPSGTTYSWTLTDPSLGALNQSTGSVVDFTAGSSMGSLALFVNATLNGVTRQSVAVPVQIANSANATLTAVAVSPSAPSVATGGSVTFSATPSCTGGSCPAGSSFVWSLTRGTMGHLSSTTGASVTFTAAQTTGTVTLFVNATLNGVTVQSTPVTITVTSGSSSPLGFVTSNWLWLVIALVVVAIIVAVVLARRRKPQVQPPAPGAPSGTAASPPPPEWKET